MLNLVCQPVRTTSFFCFTLFNSDPELFSVMNMNDRFAQLPWSYDGKALPHVLAETTICFNQIFPVVFIRCLLPIDCFANFWQFKSGGGVSLSRSTQDSWNLSEWGRQAPADHLSVSCLGCKTSVDTEVPGGPHDTGENRNHDWWTAYQRKGDRTRIHCNILSAS